MTALHHRRARTGVHEQRAIGPDAGGAARERRADVPAAQPITTREGRAFEFRQLRPVGREPDQRGHEQIQDVDTPDAGPQLA